MQKKYICNHCDRQFNDKSFHHLCNTGFRKRHHSFSLNPGYCEQSCTINCVQIVPQTWKQRYEMYMKRSKEELASMMAERDKITFPDACSECQMNNHTTMTTNVAYSSDLGASASYVYSSSTEQ
jgi:hypothetical protein